MSWETIQRSYDPEAFYTPASDEQGHGRKFSVQLPTDVAARVGEVVADPGLPHYQTAAHVIRDAVVHVLMKRQKGLTNQQTVRDINMMLHRLNAERLSNRIADTEQTIRSYEKAMMLSEGRGDARNLREAILQAEEVMLDMEEPYRGQLQSSVHEYKGKLGELEGT